MIKNALQAIEGVEVWPLISLSIFFIFFIVLIIWVIKVDRKYIKKMEQLPLDKGETKQSYDEN